MNKILISSIGTTGDIKPFKHLAQELLEERFEVEVFSFPIYEKMFTNQNIKFSPVGGNANSEYIQKVVANIISAPNIFEELKIMTNQMIMLDFDQRYETLLEKMKLFDFAIIHIADAAAQAAAEELNLPWIMVRFETSSVPTSKVSSPPIMKNFGSLINKLSWNVGELILKKFDKILDEKLKNLKFSNWEKKPVLIRNQSPILNLCACSPILSPNHSDFPKTFHITGQWIKEQQAKDETSSILEFARNNKNEFALVTLGSMGGAKGEELADLFINIFNDLKIKAIIQKGVANIFKKGFQSENILFCDYIPHEQIIPLSMFVIHHAGSGTAHSVLRFKKPSILIPHILDQEFFSNRLIELGVAPGSTSIKAINYSRLKKLIEKLISNYSYYKSNAEKYGVKLLSEDGVRKSVNLIKEIMK